MQFDFFALSTTLIDTAKLQLPPISLYPFVPFCTFLWPFVTFCVVFGTSYNGLSLRESTDYGQAVAGGAAPDN